MHTALCTEHSAKSTEQCSLDKEYNAACSECTVLTAVNLITLMKGCGPDRRHVAQCMYSAGTVQSLSVKYTSGCVKKGKYIYLKCYMVTQKRYVSSKTGD